MKLILAALLFSTLTPALAQESRGVELGTVDAWSNWFHTSEVVDVLQVCADVHGRFQHVNAHRPYSGELAEAIPVGIKTGTHTDGQSYFALSCRIRVYRQPHKALSQTETAPFRQM